MKQFRNDINGLRAIAVLGVVFFHYGFWFVPGGYLGVDIFFVISGFLMTQIIVSRLQTERFSIWGFYIARARRIVPALIAVCAVLCLFGLFVVDPLTYSDLARQTIASLLFYSNMQYSNQAGYFDQSSATKWLLHTWSLSVEWQFYIVYPIIVALIWRVRPSLTLLRGAFAIGILLSFAGCLAIYNIRPAAAFYWLPPRAWELLAGGLVALATPIASPVTARVAQLGGLAVIVVCMLAFGEFTPWPSSWTVLPVAATAAIIWANKGSSRLTGVLPLRVIGLWSYSIYLWHWPMGVVLKYLEIDTSPWTRLALLVAVMLAGGFALQAISGRVAAASPRLQWGGFAATAAVVLAISVLGTNENGLQIRRPALVQRLADLRAATTDWAFPSRCPHLAGARWLSACQLPKGTAPTNSGVLVLGDSISQAIYGRWANSTNPSQPPITFISYGGCMFIVGVNRREPGYTCPPFVNEALDVAEKGKFQRVVIASLWSGYFAKDAQDTCYIEGDRCEPKRGAAREAALLKAMDGLQQRLERIRRTGKAVTIVLALPYSPYDVPRELAKRLFLDWNAQPIEGIDRGTFEADDAFFRTHLKAMAAAIGADVIDPVPSMCDATTCPTVGEGMRSLYRDSVHVRASVIQGDRFRFLDPMLDVGAEPVSASRN